MKKGRGRNDPEELPISSHTPCLECSKVEHKSHTLRDFLLAVCVAIIALSGTVITDFNESKRAREQAQLDREQLARKEYLDYARPIIEEAFSIIVKEQSKMCIYDEFIVEEDASSVEKRAAQDLSPELAEKKMETSPSRGALFPGRANFRMDSLDPPHPILISEAERSKVEVRRVGYRQSHPEDVSPIEAQIALNKLQMIDKNGKLVKHFLDAINVSNASVFDGYFVNFQSAAMGGPHTPSVSEGRSSRVVKALSDFTDEARRQLGIQEGSAASVADAEDRSLIVSLINYERVRCEN